MFFFSNINTNEAIIKWTHNDDEKVKNLINTNIRMTCYQSENKLLYDNSYELH